jgi:pimeloyl-ACP methyl ester carboxylesterase
MKAYFIPGLGADKTVFRNIKLPNTLEPLYLEWIEPLPNESLCNYASRLSSRIDQSEPFILVGLSFGGMLAVEISKIHKPSRLILISSIPGIQDLPTIYKWAGRLRLQKMVPVSLFIKASRLKRFFTTETKEDKVFLLEMIRKTDPKFIKWALNAILHWDNKMLPENCIHIHGKMDGILPINCTHPTHVIPRGGHLMVMNRAREINKILEENLIL